MYCNYQTLYFGDDGYVVRCNQCNHYQVTFISTMLTLSEEEFKELGNMVRQKCNEPDYAFTENSKSVILQTPSLTTCIILTRKEALRFSEIFDAADSEIRSLELIQLFNPVN